MSSPKVNNPGAQGNKATFSIGGRSYTTGAVPASKVANLTVQEAEGLIASGQATPDSSTYLDQFPWTHPPK